MQKADARAYNIVIRTTYKFEGPFRGDYDLFLTLLDQYKGDLIGAEYIRMDEPGTETKSKYNISVINL
jgi:hypothetical protein